MASVERKQDKRRPFYRGNGVSRQTSAEIVTEARHSLRTLGTRRPFTPLEDHRRLFGAASSRTRDARPPSTFSLHSQNFEAPDSRPNSGTRLSPLDHKPKLPFLQNEGCSERKKASFKPPAGRVDQGGAGATRASHQSAGSLTRLPPVSRHSNDSESENKKDPLMLSVESYQKANRHSFGVSEGRPKETVTHSPTRERGTPQHTRANVYQAKPAIKGADADGRHRDAAGSDETEFWNSEVLPVTQVFEAAAPDEGGTVSEETVKYLCDACNGLRDALASRGMLGQRFKKRSSVLRALFRLIDLGSDQLNLTVAKLILAINVSGNNLLNVCKLIFKISRSPSNDALFQDISIIDSLLSLLHSQDVDSTGETVLYCVGSLKLLSGNSSLARLLLDKDVIRVLLLLAQRLVPSTGPAAPSNTDHALAGHILVQLTAALRNVADFSESRPSFLSNDVFSILCEVTDHHQADQDMCLNVARIFSKLSSYAECCYALAETPSCYRLFLDLLSKHSMKQDLVVRLLFTIGNLAARSNEARERVYEEDGAVDVLLDLFQRYQQTPDQPQHSRNDVRTEDDVLIKLIRVLANLSMNPTVGVALAANTSCVQLLLEVMECRSVEESTELVINAAATINNLSYYQGTTSVIHGQNIRVSKLLLRLLLSSHMDAVLEATRVFGNLSHVPEVRRFMVKNKVHQFVVTLLDSKNPEVCYSACGVLMNLSADPQNRSTLTEEGAVKKLIECLQDFGPQDWLLAGAACQTLWNFTEDGDQQDTEDLLEILSLYSDQKALQWPSNDDMKSYQKACWKLEFLPVAERLKKRLQSHEASPEQISEPS